MAQLRKSRPHILRNCLASCQRPLRFELLETRRLLAANITHAAELPLANCAAEEVRELAAPTPLGAPVQDNDTLPQALDFLLLPQVHGAQIPTWQAPAPSPQPSSQSTVIETVYDTWRPDVTASWGGVHAPHSIVPATFISPPDDVVQRVDETQRLPQEATQRQRPDETTQAVIDLALRGLQAEAEEWTKEPHAIALAADVDGDAQSEIGILHAGTWIFDTNHDGTFDVHDFTVRQRTDPTERLAVREGAAQASRSTSEISPNSSFTAHEAWLRSLLPQLSTESLAALMRGEGIPIFASDSPSEHLANQGAEHVSETPILGIPPTAVAPEASGSVSDHAISGGNVANRPSSTNR